MPVGEVVMTNRLYVANVPFDTTVDALRRHFATCGGVADVELGSEHRRNERGLARVTMTSPAYAAAAVGRLDRAAFQGRLLRVSDSPIDREKAAATVRIVQQFRERANMTYDLDCAGMPLTLRMFPIEGERWRVETRSTEAVNAVVVTASAATRRDALGAVLRQWNERASSSSPASIDAEGLLRAMSDVNAI
jgi:RNA recognition motif-containing protein